MFPVSLLRQLKLFLVASFTYHSGFGFFVVPNTLVTDSIIICVMMYMFMFKPYTNIIEIFVISKINLFFFNFFPEDKPGRSLDNLICIGQQYVIRLQIKLLLSSRPDSSKRLQNCPNIKKPLTFIKGLYIIEKDRL